MRIFIGLSVPQDFVAHYGTIQKYLKNEQMVDEFYAPEDLHITLSFLGEIEEEALSRLSSLADLTKKFTPVEMSVTDVETFGKPTSGVWLVCDAAYTLYDFHAHLIMGLETMGFKPDLRPFKPHITVSKQKNVLPFTEMAPKLPKFQAAQLHVYKSLETKKPFRYERLFTYSLTGK